MLVQLYVDNDTRLRLQQIAIDLGRTIPDLCAAAVSEAALQQLREVPPEPPKIVVSPDDKPECPVCNKVLEPDEFMIEGLITAYEGSCPEHGVFDVLVEEDEEEEP